MLAALAATQGGQPAPLQAAMPLHCLSILPSCLVGKESALASEARCSDPAPMLHCRGRSLLEAFQQTLQLGGQSALILRLLLSAAYSRLQHLGQPGGEFIAARIAGEAVGCDTLVLGRWLAAQNAQYTLLWGVT